MTHQELRNWLENLVTDAKDTLRLVNEGASPTLIGERFNDVEYDFERAAVEADKL